MYHRILAPSICYIVHNLRITFAELGGKEAFLGKYKCYFQKSMTILDILNSTRGTSNKLALSFRNEQLYKVFQSHFYTIPRAFKEQSTVLLKEWRHQCECIIAQRLRRSQQMFSLYSRLWEEKALKLFYKRMRNVMLKRTKRFILGGAAFSTFNWEKERIPEMEMRKHMNEFSYVETLKNVTLCQNCKKSKSAQGDNVCSCEDYKPNKEVKYDNWEVFVEKKDLVVWRRLVSHSGHFEYKVYGSYPDVTAEQFLNVQIDTKYRKIWDNTAIVLEVIERDPKTTNGSDLLYWEMLWPMMFANRDYVFTRRYLIDYQKKMILLANKSTSHPRYGEKPDKFRVKDYNSMMVIKPYKELKSLGIEFVLTYYDNPGVNIPAKITNWVAMRAMPDFLERLRDASKKYKDYCKQHGVECVCQFRQIAVPTFKSWNEKYYFLIEPSEDLIFDNTIFEPQHLLKKNKYTKERDESDSRRKPPSSDEGAPSNKKIDDSDSSVAEEQSTPSEETSSSQPTPSIQRGTRKFWKYLQVSYYIS